MLDILFPRTCCGCRSLGSYICKSCKKSLQPHSEICPITHKNSPWYATRQDLLTVTSPLDGCIVLFRFEPIIKKLIRQLKYYHRADISWFLGERLALALQSHEILWKLITQNSKLIISYVPSHRIRHYITKWYNQSQLLAQSLSQSLERTSLWGKMSAGQKGHIQQTCRKTKNTHSQVGMTKVERKNNLTDAFEVITQIPVWSTIIIVDDVLTSGTTMIEMAKTIKKSQPDCQVWGICVARNG
jgi:ComF family protein